MLGQHGEEGENERVVVVRSALMIDAILAPLLHFVLEILLASGNLRLQLAKESGEIGEILGGETGGRRLCPTEKIGGDGLQKWKNFQAKNKSISDGKPKPC